MIIKLWYNLLMMNFIIGILVGVSAGAWVYSKQMRRSGNNTQNSLTIAAVVAVILFVVVWTVAVMVDSAIK
jgi:uncharacterized membrane protein YidH (DUF202 family)